MAKNRPDSPAPEADKPAKPSKAKPTKPAPKKRAPGEFSWHPFWRGLVSLLVVLHLTAVFSAPWNLLAPEVEPFDAKLLVDEQGTPQPDLVRLQKPIVSDSLHRFFHDYLNLLYLNHGYEFFAPNPVPSRVIDYEVTQPNGEVLTGRLPSLDDQWPRLLYHRHMMLVDQEQMPGMGRSAAMRYADHLATVHGGKSQLQLKIHLLLSPAQVLEGMSPEDPITYKELAAIEGSPRVSGSTDTPAESELVPSANPGAQ